jgi:hypothetical protein
MALLPRSFNWDVWSYGLKWVEATDSFAVENLKLGTIGVVHKHKLASLFLR